MFYDALLTEPCCCKCALPFCENNARRNVKKVKLVKLSREVWSLLFLLLVSNLGSCRCTYTSLVTCCLVSSSSIPALYPGVLQYTGDDAKLFICFLNKGRTIEQQRIFFLSLKKTLFRRRWTKKSLFSPHMLKNIPTRGNFILEMEKIGPLPS